MSHPRRRKVARVAQIAFALLAAAWLGRYVHFCLTAEPPGVGLTPWTPARRPLEQDATAALQAALIALPPMPVTRPPPPPGRQWTETVEIAPDLSEALTGEWNPRRRINVQAIVDYLETPATVDAIAQLQALTGRPIEDRPPWEQMPNFGAIRQSSRLLSAHSRYAREQQRDPNAAVLSFRTSLWLAGEVRGPSLISHLVANAMEDLTMTELAHWVLEDEQLPAPIAAELMQSLAALPSLDAMWRQMLEGERLMQRGAIDCYYTLDDDGNGVLLMGADAAGGAGSWFNILDCNSPLWNLTAFAYNDRVSVSAKVDALYSEVARAPGLTYTDARRLLDRFAPDAYYDVVDGPVVRQSGADPRRTFAIFARLVARRRAAMIMLALNQYHQQHHRHPSDLFALAPDFIATLPDDPFCGNAFGYRPSAPQGYQLWSCGGNGVDEGGTEVNPGSWSDYYLRGGDELYVESRPDGEAEPESIAVEGDGDGGQADE